MDRHPNSLSFLESISSAHLGMVWLELIIRTLLSGPCLTKSSSVLPLNAIPYSKNCYRQIRFQARAMKFSSVLLTSLVTSCVSAYGIVAWKNAGYTGTLAEFVSYSELVSHLNYCR